MQYSKWCLVLAIVAMPLACIQSDSVTGGNGSSVRVLLTDSPFPYDDMKSVDIYVVKVEASTASDSSAISDPSTWTTIAEPHRAVNVLALSDGATELLGENELSAATYRAVRMTIDVDSSSITRADGTPQAVIWQATGRDVLNALVESPVSAPASGADIVIDFDLGRSFEFVGADSSHTETLLFIPWIRAVNAAATGTIEGTVADTSGAARNQVVVAERRFPNGGEWYYSAATSHVASDGSYRLRYLAEGHYHVYAWAEAPNGDPIMTETRTVDITAGQVVTIPGLTLGPDTSSVVVDSGTYGGGGDSAAGGGSDSTTNGAAVMRPETLRRTGLQAIRK